MAPAERDFFVELRRLVDAAGLSFRTLEQSTSAARSDAGESAFYSKSQWGRWLNGQSRPPRRAVRKLAEKLGDDDISAEHLVDLWERAFVPTGYPQAAEATALNVRDIQQDAEMPGQLDPRSEAEFLARYRRHVIEYHGMLEPPDFEYRRRVRVADLYVPPAIVQIIRGSPALPPRKVTLQQFSEEISRTVLLGDPGSGKTTAAQVLMYDQAVKPGGWVPFMVTLRDFAAGTAKRSVAGYLEDKLESFYQCPAPSGSVQRLLLSGEALVILDSTSHSEDRDHAYPHGQDHPSSDHSRRTGRSA